MFFSPLHWFVAVAEFGLALLPKASHASERGSTEIPSATPSGVTVRAEDGGPTIDAIDAVSVPSALERAVHVAFDATIAALDPRVVDLEECARRDAEAERRAEELAQQVASASAALPQPARERIDAIAERVASAQLQIMAFAINRKNRGEAGSAETEAEARDRASFRREVEPLLRALRANA